MEETKYTSRAYLRSNINIHKGIISDAAPRKRSLLVGITVLK
ncbi:hypothetical protein [Haloimpatiens lingqiaonensis]|nr:hypothetical protein [Haloimpatiens lingqiaonensis]